MLSLYLKALIPRWQAANSASSKSKITGMHRRGRRGKARKGNGCCGATRM